MLKKEIEEVEKGCTEILGGDFYCGDNFGTLCSDCKIKLQTLKLCEDKFNEELQKIKDELNEMNVVCPECFSNFSLKFSYENDNPIDEFFENHSQGTSHVKIGIEDASSSEETDKTPSERSSPILESEDRTFSSNLDGDNSKKGEKS